jgi:hypothetical protein
MNAAHLLSTARIFSFGLLIGTIALSLSLTACGFTPDDDDSDPTIWPAVPVGSLVVTEILANPNVGRPEFVEIENSSDSTVSLQACQVSDGGSSAHDFVLNVPLSLEPGQLAVLSSAEYLGNNEGELVPDALWDGIVLNQSDETESFTLSCPDGIGGRQIIDTVAFDWGSLGVARGRSWQLAIDADATANDDPANWCPAPAQDDAIYAEIDGVSDYGSPGSPSTCESLGGLAPSTAGEVVISELLIHEFDGLREWFELHNPGTEAVDIRNCVLIDEALGNASDPNSHTINYEAGETVIGAGGYLLLSRTETDITEDGGLISDYPYSQLSFTNTDLQRLAIDCPVGDNLVRIDEVIYDWSERSSTYRGYSLSLSDSTLDAEANDNPDNWCVGSDVYYTSTSTDVPPVTTTAYGSPGAANPACPAPGPYPAPGELVITELMVDEFVGLREWVEVHNPGLGDLDLFGCELVDVAVSEVEDSDAHDRHRLTPEGGDTTVPAGGYLVLSKSDIAITSDGAVIADYAYGGEITLNNSDPQYLWIDCPDSSGAMTSIDRIEFDWGDYGTAHKGASISLSLTSYTAVDNDDAGNWCLAQSSDSYFSHTTTDVPPVTYEATGTPGVSNSACQ